MFLDDHDERIEVNRLDRLLEWRRRRPSAFNRVKIVQVTHQITGKSGKGTVHTLDIFTNEHAARTKMGQHLFQRHGLMFWTMAAIVDENVNWADRLLEICPEPPVTLIADVNGDVLSRVASACRIDIDAMHVALRTKIGRPHLQAAAPIYTNLNDLHGSAHELSQVPLINIEVML